jgi:hypothetical protein
MNPHSKKKSTPFISEISLISDAIPAEGDAG